MTAIQKLELKDKKPLTRIWIGDCRKIMSSVLKKDTQRFNLIFADPPYNIDVEYDVWDDKLSAEEYWHFTEKWLTSCNQLLTDDGSMWVYVTPNLGYRIANFMDCELKLKFVNRIVVVQRFGQHNTSRFISGYRDLLYFCKNPDIRIWNPHSILVPSDRAAKYSDPRTRRKAENPGLRVPLDYWGEAEPFFGRVQGNNAERRRLHDNQVPEKVMERVILSASSEKDWVFDPFTGSGTTATVARALKRNFVGCEISRQYARSAMERVKAGAVRISNSNR